MSKKKSAPRKDGLFSSQIYIGMGEDGKRKYKTVYGKTYKEAQTKANTIKTSMHKGLDIAAERDTFYTWSQRWLKVKSSEISAGRLVVYNSHVKHLTQHLELIPMAKIRPADIQEIITDLSTVNPNTGRPMARKTLNELKGTAAQIFQFAIDNRVIDFNPASSVRIPRGQESQSRRALSGTEQAWVLDTPHRAQRAAMIMMYSGLRRGELIPLLWSDINTDLQTISVSKTVEKIDGSFHIKDTAKTKAGIRVVRIPQQLVDFLSAEPREGDYVCFSAKGGMHTPSSWSRMWKSYLADLNIKYGDFSDYIKQPRSKFDPDGVPYVIPNITPHWLRHTFATMLYLAGVDALTAKDQMGHADIKTTLDIYTHLDRIYTHKSMSKLDDFLKSASKMQVKNS